MKQPGLETADGACVDFNEISIESLGAHVLFGEIDETTMKERHARSLSKQTNCLKRKN